MEQLSGAGCGVCSRLPKTAVLGIWGTHTASGSSLFHNYSPSPLPREAAQEEDAGEQEDAAGHCGQRSRSGRRPRGLREPLPACRSPQPSTPAQCFRGGERGGLRRPFSERSSLLPRLPGGCKTRTWGMDQKGPAFPRGATLLLGEQLTGTLFREGQRPSLSEKDLE